MLTVQPNLINNLRPQSFRGEHSRNSEYIDYSEVPCDTDYFCRGRDDFDIDFEKEQSKQELDLWQQTKSNLDSIAKTTEKVPVLKTGTKVMSGLISIAIGWGGLRWGTVGTLEVLSKIGKTSLMQSIKGCADRGLEVLSGLYKQGKTYTKNTDLYKSLMTKISDYQTKFLSSDLGIKYTNAKTAIKTSPIYDRIIGAKDSSIDYVKSLNPKRVFVETMGVAGGGTAAVNTLGGKTVDGTKHFVETDDNGGYVIDGRNYSEDYRYAS